MCWVRTRDDTDGDPLAHVSLALTTGAGCVTQEGGLAGAKAALDPKRVATHVRFCTETLQNAVVILDAARQEEDRNSAKREEQRQRLKVRQSPRAQREATPSTARSRLAQPPLSVVLPGGKRFTSTRLYGPPASPRFAARSTKQKALAYRNKSTNQPPPLGLAAQAETEMRKADEERKVAEETLKFQQAQAAAEANEQRLQRMRDQWSVPAPEEPDKPAKEPRKKASRKTKAAAAGSDSSDDDMGDGEGPRGKPKSSSKSAKAALAAAGLDSSSEDELELAEVSHLPPLPHHPPLASHPTCVCPGLASSLSLAA